MLQTLKLHRLMMLFRTAIFVISVLSGCGGSTEIEFAVVHLRDQPGDQITEVLSYETYPGLDNSAGAAALQVQISLERKYNYQIIERVTAEGVDVQKVRDKLVELYKLPPNAPEETDQFALCPLTVVVPAGAKAIVTIEWTERWAEGVINEGVAGQGNRLGTYTVFLGYVEPCSLIKQENRR